MHWNLNNRGIAAKHSLEREQGLYHEAELQYKDGVPITGEPDSGTTFSLPPPSAHEAVTETKKGLIAPAVTADSATILVVEDEPALREATTEFLQTYGHAVLTAATGEEALRVANKFSGKIDLLLTDIVMPGGSGPELARHLLASRPELCVLYMSGYAENVWLGDHIPDLKGECLQKPFRLRTLQKKIAELLHHKIDPE